MASKHLPPELIAHSVSFLQTADTHDVCFGGKTNHLEFSGLVDLVEKRFFEAGLREPELWEVCDPAWKVVDESGYAEGVRYLRTTYDIPRRRRDPAQRKICSFFPHKDGRARCWGCGAKHAVAA